MTAGKANPDGRSHECPDKEADEYGYRDNEYPIPKSGIEAQHKAVADRLQIPGKSSHRIKMPHDVAIATVTTDPISVAQRYLSQLIGSVP
jgi:hypothetical protein